MNPREKILGLGMLHLMRGEPIPLDILAQAEELGLMLEDFGEPPIREREARALRLNNKGEDLYGE